MCLAFVTATPAEARKKKKADAAAQAPKPKPKPSVDRDGLFHVTKMKTDWFFSIPDSLLGRQILATVRFTSTPAGTGKYGGEQLAEQTLYWEMAPDSVLLLRSNLIINVADSTDAISRAVTLANSNPIIGSFKIEGTDSLKNYKIKVTGFFNEDNSALGLSQSYKRAFGLSGQASSYVEDIKSLPLNTEVRVVKTFNSTSTPSIPATAYTGKATLGLNYSFVLLPSNPMMRRYFDRRVGYFTDRFNVFSDQQQRVTSKTFITRWRLEPRPEDVEKMRRGELVEPQKPIIYYIDPATPKQWRKYLIQGVNDWQVAFEKAGFKNAIMGMEWPEGDSTMSMEDARYSCIRYLASDIENAYGPHVHDPRTGEILESHICWYHNVMSLLHDWYMVQASSIDEAARCMNFDEELMGELIRFVSSHEVGHTLGLRHNFGASSTVPVDSLRDKAWVERYGHTPSIMDYARFNYVAQPEDGLSRKGIFPRINDYDMWAIMWGHKPMLDARDEDEDHAMLEELVKTHLTGNKRLWWGDGEGYRGIDPRCQTEDLGDDAVKASEYGIRNLKREIKDLQEWSYDKKDIAGRNLSDMYNQIVGQFMRYNGHVAGNIGGTFINYKSIDESGDIFSPVPRDRQKRALDYLDRNVFTDPTWVIDVPYIHRLSSEPVELMNRVGTAAIRQLFNRIPYLAEQYPATDLFTDLNTMLFRGKTTDYRAELQRSYVSQLINEYQYAGVGDKVRGAALIALKSLKSKTAALMATAADATTRAHFASLNDAIERALVIK